VSEPAASLPPATAPADDEVASSLRGFGPVGLVALALIVLTGNVQVAPMVFVPLGALLTLLWVRLSRTPWSAIGYVRPRSWVVTILTGTLAGAALKLAMKAIVTPLFSADPVNHAYHFLAGNTAILPAATLAMLNAGFAEETVFRGYLFERLGRLLGPGAWAKAVVVLVTTTGFAFGHLHDQGWPGVWQAGITGLVFGTTYAVTGRLPLVMIVHAAFDLTALAMIYWNLETRVAHLIFR
jgi:membrane protease YdiL (CAAX protease family)